MIILLFKLINTLNLIHLDVNLYHMHSFDIEFCGLYDYNTILKMYKLKIQEINNWYSFDNENGDTIGHLILTNRNTNTIFINDSYLEKELKNSTSIILRDLVDENHINEYNKHEFLIPGASIVKAEDKSYLLTLPQLDINELCKIKFRVFVKPLIIENTLLTVSRCRNLLKNVTKQKNDFLNKKYVLLFFRNDISRISTFILNLINVLYGNNEITDEVLLQLFKNTKNDFISDNIRQNWDNEFIKNNITEISLKNQYIYLMLLTDIVNLLKLSKDQNFKFKIYTVLTKEVSSIGQPLIMLSVDITNNKFIIPREVIIICNNNKELSYKRFIHLENKICYYFDKSEIIDKKINFIRIAFLTSKGRFESKELKV